MLTKQKRLYRVQGRKLFFHRKKVFLQPSAGLQTECGLKLFNQKDVLGVKLMQRMNGNDFSDSLTFPPGKHEVDICGFW